MPVDLDESAFHLPIPITERDLLTEYTGEREGVLFVGRWEEGKNPEPFIDLIEQTKLPAKVMTSPNGVKKFEDRLSKLGVKYDVRASIVGQEKVDFIKSSRIAFNPSVIESYGMAFYEQIIQLPTLVLENQRWTNNFDTDFFTCNKKNMAEVVTTLYNEYDDPKKYYKEGVLKAYQILDSDSYKYWNVCFDDFTAKKSNSNTAGILKHNTIKYGDYIKSLDRTQICIDDIKSVYNNKHKYTITYTDNDTWLSNDKDFVVPTETESLFVWE